MPRSRTDRDRGFDAPAARPSHSSLPRIEELETPAAQRTHGPRSFAVPPPRRRLVGAFVGISLLVLGLPLFLAEVPRRRLVDAIVGISLVVLGLPGPAIAESRTPSVVDVVETSRWGPPSPDAVGLTYDPVSARLLVVASEVEEMSTPYARLNPWVFHTNGGVDDTFVTVDPATG